MIHLYLKFKKQDSTNKTRLAFANPNLHCHWLTLYRDVIELFQFVKIKAEFHSLIILFFFFFE